jgi:hypothetical protein
MSKDSSVDSEESTKEVVNNESYIKRFKIFRSLFKIFFVLSIIIFVLAQFAGSKVIAQAEIIREFNRKIDIISPYVDRKIKDRLVSDFSLMKGEKDYLNINKKFDSIFKQNNLTP